MDYIPKHDDAHIYVIRVEEAITQPTYLRWVTSYTCPDIPPPKVFTLPTHWDKHTVVFMQLLGSYCIAGKFCEKLHLMLNLAK